MFDQISEYYFPEKSIHKINHHKVLIGENDMPHMFHHDDSYALHGKIKCSLNNKNNYHLLNADFMSSIVTDTFIVFNLHIKLVRN